MYKYQATIKDTHLFQNIDNGNVCEVSNELLFNKETIRGDVLPSDVSPTEMALILIEFNTFIEFP